MQKWRSSHTEAASVPLTLLCDDFSDFCGYLKFQISKLLQSGSFYPALCSNPPWLLIFVLPKIHICDSKKQENMMKMSVSHQYFKPRLNFMGQIGPYNFVPDSSFTPSSLQFSVMWNWAIQSCITHCFYNSSQSLVCSFCRVICLSILSVTPSVESPV